ncbi:ATP-binding protein [Roseibacterium sp. SDUM158016]|uniref:ATP-binding protein n=1 Tax=Roseicyclus sediminis TaxID=2980997 RepID=UPI0021CECB9A|nr:ATP-binding protein [Roseibacterium sp. SDUM158016]MCU4652465.1 ATP-binding protein [Roseibacterium sp. SDUM158016]
MRAVPRYRIDLTDPARCRLGFRTGDGAIGPMLSELSRHLHGLGVGRELVEDGMIALAEILNNVEEHAYAGQAGGCVHVELAADDGALRCAVEDLGAPMPGGSLPSGTMPASDPAAPESWPEGGFGWAMVRRLVHDIRYVRTEDRNRLCFTISPASAPRRGTPG